MKNIILILGLAMALVNCAKDDDATTASSEDVASSVEDAVTSISALMDDAEGESYATSMKQSPVDSFRDLLFPKAYAESCVRPIAQACESQTKASVLDDCTVFGGNVVANGFINLAFSTVDCTMNSDGDEVSRTYDYTLSGPRNGIMEVSSEDHTDYRGNTIGGGASIEKTASGWDLDILGKHKVFTRNGRIRMDKSLRTLSPLSISGGLGRGQRQVSNGQLEVIHNLAEFTATYTANQLGWSNSCCHPVSGSLSVEYTGSKTGSGEIAFASCGEAEITVNGEVQNVELTYCE